MPPNLLGYIERIANIKTDSGRSSQNFVLSYSKTPKLAFPYSRVKTYLLEGMQAAGENNLTDQVRD